MNPNRPGTASGGLARKLIEAGLLAVSLVAAAAAAVSASLM